VRGETPVLETARGADWDTELSRRVDHTLTLLVRGSGGDREALERTATRCAEAVAQMLREGARLRQELGTPGAGEVIEGAGEPLGASGASRRLYDELRRLADLDMPVVISGEPGCGKDFCARTLHAISRRASLPLIAVECSTLRPETAASELFGHVRGAFTGATHDHAGLLESAGEGVLQFDGISALVPSVQAMLLRTLQIRKFMPVGSTTERDFRARIVVTSTRPLEELVAAGELREDLAQRLTGLNVRVPPLRERGDDILLFARIALERQSAQLGRKLRLSRHAEQHLLSQPWPGNVRQLKSVVTRAAVLADGDIIGVEDLRDDVSTADDGSPEAEDGLNLTRKVVLNMLRQRGELTPRELIRNLGIGRTTASTALSDLVDQGLAQRVGKGRSSKYLPT
jgi:two-component system, NtrC family, response regulator HydG